MATNKVRINRLLRAAPGSFYLVLNKMSEYLSRNHNRGWDNVSQATISNGKKLKMTYGGGVITHLGSQMYGRPTNIIAEYVANAWDADARNVWIEIPLDKRWMRDSTIVVRDDGLGMSFGECNDKFLWIGRPRRKKEGDYTQELRRKLMAKKGVGKLAGFGIANVVEVRTIKDHNLTHFRMNHTDIKETAESRLEYEPELLEPVDTPTDENNGTSIRLMELNLVNPIPSQQFKQSLARRFGVLSDTFRVWINGVELKKEDLDYQFRFPKDGCKDEGLNGNNIRWWIGFTEKPVTDEAGRGVSVIARGRLAQEPFFFNLSGGVQQQLGMQYLVGEVYADYLDDYPDDDLIITGRMQIRWDHPEAVPLEEWGRRKIKEVLKEWGERRQKKKIRDLKVSTDLMDRMGRFSAHERKGIMKAVDKLSTVPTLEQEKFEEQVQFLVEGYEDKATMDIIHDFDPTYPDAYPAFIEMLKEWDVAKAIRIAQLVEGNIEIIDNFKKMIDAGVTEKPAMHDLLKKNPWLVDQSWDLLEYEPALDEILQKYVDPKKTKARAGPGATMPDFFCLAGSRTAKVVEVKRPSEPVGVKELDQIKDYVFYLQEHLSKTTDIRSSIDHVHGHLIGGYFTVNARYVEKMTSWDVFTATWDDLVRNARRSYRDYFDILRGRAPPDHPRMQALDRSETVLQDH